MAFDMFNRQSKVGAPYLSMNRDLCGSGPTAERPLRGGLFVLRRTVSGWRHSKRVPLRRCGSAAVRAFDARRKRMLSRRIFAASSILGKTEHAFYRFRVYSQVGELFLLYFSSVSPTPYAAQRRRASVVLECRISLFTGNAAVRRRPFWGKRSIRFIDFDFVLKWGKWNFFVMFCLCSTDALRRYAA